MAQISDYNSGIAQEGELRYALSSLRAELAEVHQLSHELAILLGLPVPRSLHEAIRLVRIANAIPTATKLLPRWFDLGAKAAVASFAAEASSRASELKNLADSLFASYSPGLLNIDLEETISAFNDGVMATTSSLVVTGRLDVKFERILQDAKQRSRDEELASLQSALQVKQGIAWFTEQRERIKDELDISMGGPTLGVPTLPEERSTRAVSKGLQPRPLYSLN